MSKLLPYRFYTFPCLLCGQPIAGKGREPEVQGKLHKQCADEYMAQRKLSTLEIPTLTHLPLFG